VCGPLDIKFTLWLLKAVEKAGFHWDYGVNKMEHMYHLSVISSSFIQSLNNRKIKLKIKKKFRQHSYNQ
jgi:hypothetical protein